jgi:hypothetical protein
MSRPLPRYCGYRTCAAAATHLIDGKHRHTLACPRHLDAQLRWAGDGARASPIPGATPEQADTLF